MPLYYVTGISGSGKSTVLQELKRLGYEAYDVDEAGPVTAKWHNDKTGYVHPKSSVKTEDRTPEFIADHSWRVSRQEVADLAKQAGAKNIFVCGVVANEEEFSDLFKLVFSLKVDPATLKQRLINRTNNDWGKQPHELEQTLEWQRYTDENHQKLGYTIIDASQSVEAVANEILRCVHDDSR